MSRTITFRYYVSTTRSVKNYNLFLIIKKRTITFETFGLRHVVSRTIILRHYALKIIKRQRSNRLFDFVSFHWMISSIGRAFALHANGFVFKSRIILVLHITCRRLLFKTPSVLDYCYPRHYVS